MQIKVKNIYNDAISWLWLCTYKIRIVEKYICFPVNCTQHGRMTPLGREEGRNWCQEGTQGMMCASFYFSKKNYVVNMRQC